jgi:succinate dehydrogenase/fumarate reductase flavoprotein subunit
MQESFDLVVIGTGHGGSPPAYRSRRAGWRVAVVDELPYKESRITAAAERRRPIPLGPVTTASSRRSA